MLALAAVQAPRPFEVGVESAWCGGWSVERARVGYLANARSSAIHARAGRSGPDKTIDADRIITRAISLNPISGLITQRRQASREA